MYKFELEHYRICCILKEKKYLCICPKKLGSEIAPQITNHKKDRVCKSANLRMAHHRYADPRSGIRCILGIRDRGWVKSLKNFRIRDKHTWSATLVRQPSWISQVRKFAELICRPRIVRIVSNVICGQVDDWRAAFKSSIPNPNQGSFTHYLGRQSNVKEIAIYVRIGC